MRLEVSASCSAVLANVLLQQHGLPQQALFRVKGPVNLVRQMQLIDWVDDPALLFSPWKPAWPRQLVAGRSVMEQMRKGDVLIHQPFEDFDAVLELLREAVNDPQVLAIKQTIYRTGSDSEIMRLLAEAGFEVRLPAEGHLCCGSAGVYNILEPDLATRLRDRKAVNIAATGATVIAAGNVGCMAQLAPALDAPIVHPVELLDWATGGPKPAALTAPEPERLRINP